MHITHVTYRWQSSRLGRNCAEIEINGKAARLRETWKVISISYSLRIVWYRWSYIPSRANKVYMEDGTSGRIAVVENNFVKTGRICATRVGNGELPSAPKVARPTGILLSSREIWRVFGMTTDDSRFRPPNKSELAIPTVPGLAPHPTSVGTPLHVDEPRRWKIIRYVMPNEEYEIQFSSLTYKMRTAFWKFL